MNVKALSGADLARCFGVDRSMVTRWKKAGMPENNGLFNLPLCIKWRLEREADAMAPKSGASTEGEKWLTAFRKERARLARIERQRVQGQLISRDEVITEWCKRIAEVRQSLLALPVRLPAILEGKSAAEMRPLVKAESIRILEGYSRPGKHCEETAPAAIAPKVTKKKATK